MIFNEDYINVQTHIENVTMDIVWQSDIPSFDLSDGFNDFPHDHAHTEIFVALKGETIINFADEKFIIRENDAIIIPPNLSHITQTKEDTVVLTAQFSCVKNNQKYCHDVYKHLKRFVVSVKPIIYRNCPTFCNSINDIIQNKNDTVSYINALAFTKALLEISDLNLQQSQTRINSLPKNNFKDIKQLVLIDNIVAGRYNQNINTKKVAEELFISRRQLDRIALKRFGMPFYSAIIQKRVVSAAELLINSDLRIEQIALKVGFNSSNSLYKAFEKHYKCTPNEYRKKIKNLN